MALLSCPLFWQPYRMPRPAEARCRGSTFTRIHFGPPNRCIRPHVPPAAAPAHPPACIEKAFASGSSETKAKTALCGTTPFAAKLRPLGVRRVFQSLVRKRSTQNARKPIYAKLRKPNQNQTRCTGLVTGPNRHLLTQALPPLGKDAPGRLSRAPSAASHHPAALCAQSKRATRSHRCISHFHDIVNYYIHLPAVCQIFFENSAEVAAEVRLRSTEAPQNSARKAKTSPKHQSRLKFPVKPPKCRLVPR